MTGFRIRSARGRKVNGGDACDATSSGLVTGFCGRSFICRRSVVAASRRAGDEFASGETIVKALRILALVVLAIALTRLVGNSMIAKIVVSKSQRSLTAYGANGRILRIFPVIVGRDPGGTKEREGDERTPEGEYYVCFKNPQSRFHLSLGLSYP